MIIKASRTIRNYATACFLPSTPQEWGMPAILCAFYATCLQPICCTAGGRAPTIRYLSVDTCTLSARCSRFMARKTRGGGAPAPGWGRRTRTRPWIGACRIRQGRGVWTRCVVSPAYENIDEWCTQQTWPTRGFGNVFMWLGSISMPTDPVAEKTSLTNHCCAN